MSDKIAWLPILLALGEEEVARIMDSSPDTASAILEAHANFDQAVDEVDALKHLGHEGERPNPAPLDPEPPPPPPGDDDPGTVNDPPKGGG